MHTAHGALSRAKFMLAPSTRGHLVAKSEWRRASEHCVSAEIAIKQRGNKMSKRTLQTVTHAAVRQRSQMRRTSSPPPPQPICECVFYFSLSPTRSILYNI